jgi:triacylglycerol esterase/lipase EstA (alpha/beta hydrolase family)
MRANQIGCLLQGVFLIFLLTGCATVFPDNSSSSGTMGSHYVPEKKQNRSTAIIFVHGVLGDSLSTWTNDATKTYWPSLLAIDPVFEDANIYVFEYPTRQFGRNPTINELAEFMRSRLQADGILEHQRLVFLSHSMGGLITRQFLIKYREQADKVLFAYFFSTPTEGSPMASLASAVSRNPQYKNMHPMEVDSYLANLLRDWLDAELGKKIRSFCSYEGKETLGTLIVDMKSATNLCNERLTPINENHIDIVKPQNTQSDSYIAFKNAYITSNQTGKIKISIRFVKPLLIYDLDPDKPCKFKLLVDAVSNSDHKLYPKIIISGNVYQKMIALTQKGEAIPKIYFEQEGRAEEGYSLLESHCPGILRYELLDFCTDKTTQSSNVRLINDYHGTTKSLMLYPSIDDIVVKNNTNFQLVNEFKTGAIKLAIETVEGQLSLLPGDIMELEALSKEQYDNKSFMDKFVYRMENKFRSTRILER